MTREVRLCSWLKEAPYLSVSYLDCMLVDLGPCLGEAWSLVVWVRIFLLNLRLWGAHRINSWCASSAAHVCVLIQWGDWGVFRALPREHGWPRRWNLLHLCVPIDRVTIKDLSLEWRLLDWCLFVDWCMLDGAHRSCLLALNAVLGWVLELLNWWVRASQPDHFLLIWLDHKILVCGLALLLGDRTSRSLWDADCSFGDHCGCHSFGSLRCVHGGLASLETCISEALVGFNNDIRLQKDVLNIAGFI